MDVFYKATFQRRKQEWVIKAGRSVPHAVEKLSLKSYHAPLFKRISNKYSILSNFTNLLITDLCFSSEFIFLWGHKGLWSGHAVSTRTCTVASPLLDIATPPQVSDGWGMAWTPNKVIVSIGDTLLSCSFYNQNVYKCVSLVLNTELGEKMQSHGQFCRANKFL